MDADAFCDRTPMTPLKIFLLICHNQRRSCSFPRNGHVLNNNPNNKNRKHVQIYTPSPSSLKSYIYKMYSMKTTLSCDMLWIPVGQNVISLHVHRLPDQIAPQSYPLFPIHHIIHINKTRPIRFQ